MENRELVKTVSDVKIYRLGNGTYEVRAKGIIPVQVETFDEAFRTAVSWCE